MSKINSYLTVLVLLVLLASLLSPIATARPPYLDAFNERYGTEDTKLDACITCHFNPGGGGPRNPYGEAYQDSGMDFAAIEDLDSDGDGFTNIENINALTFPGDPDDYPEAAEELPPEEDTRENDIPEEEPVEEPIADPPQEEEAPGFGAVFAIAGILSAICLLRNREH